jgi:DNA-binding CsgD family transcriptional regulator
MDKHQDLIDRIYEAPFAPHLWQDVLQDLADIAGARGGVLSSVPATPGGFFFSDTLQSVVEATMTESFSCGRSLEAEMLRRQGPAFFSDGSLIEEEYKAEMPFYSDVLWPHGIGHMAATQIRTTMGESLVFHVMRSRDKGPVPADALDELTSLRPHLARAVTLSIRNEFQQIQNANRALAATGLAAAAIGDTGRIIDCNALFSTLDQQVVIRSHDRLRLAHPVANALLDESLDIARRNFFDPIQASRSVALPATATAAPAVLHLIPARGILRDLFRNTAFFVIITPLGQVNPAPVDIIETLFDLTVSEARIARSLAMGNDVKDMADDFGISTETVRKHLKSIFAKTGISRQAELSATIAGLKVIQ